MHNAHPSRIEKRQLMDDRSFGHAVEQAVEIEALKSSAAAPRI